MLYVAGSHELLMKLHAEVRSFLGRSSSGISVVHRGAKVWKILRAPGC